MTTGGDLSAATAAAPFNNLKSIEQVIFAGTDAVTLDGKTFTNAEITSIQFNTTDAGVDTINTAGTARTYSFGEANTGDSAFNMKAGATTLNLELDGTATTAAGADSGAINVALNAADLASKATINIESNWAGTTDTANTTGVITAITGSTINIDGAAATTVGGLANAATVDASGLTGLFTLTGGSTAADTVIVGSGGSSINTGAGADQITLGAGVDTLIIGGGDSGIFTAAAGAAPATITGFDVITGFQAGVGGDVVALEGGLGAIDYDALTTAELNAVAGAATLSAAVDAAIGASTDGEWTAFSFGGATYALFNDAGAGFTNADDVLVQLNGVNVTTLTEDNFA